jgi:hypothetical protein
MYCWHHLFAARLRGQQTVEPLDAIWTATPVTDAVLKALIWELGVRWEISRAEGD